MAATRNMRSAAAPAPDWQERTRRHPSPAPPLRVVGRRRHVRAESRRARAMLALAVVVLVFAIFFVGLGQNLLGTQQMRLDGLQQALTTADQTNQNLLLERAQLAAPARVLELAELHLGMVSPGSVVYLTPAPVGQTVAERTKEAGLAARG